MRMGKKMYNLLDADSNSTLNKISGLKLPTKCFILPYGLSDS
jgi:hypothetical protein